MLLDRQNLLNLDKKSIPIEEKIFTITVPIISINIGREELVSKYHQLQISMHRSSSLISNLAPTLLGLAILVFSYKGNAPHWLQCYAQEWA